jgi:hypothetical protein
MLAQVADNVDEALKTHGGETAFEYKYDGARVQIHKLKWQCANFQPKAHRRDAEPARNR